ncbi:MAG: tRNA 2-thiouridine(34) synthase MnmA [Patescibacteria group bacterium]|nr:tRNA 2-thiouridine(34) synthase MnmA [Patescibacteria group bacterium]
MKKRVCVAMSGGVDSSVSAALLKHRGYDVVGAFIVNWSDTKNLKGECAWREERRDAMRVAARLDIPLHTLNFEKQYDKFVVDYMFREYRAGRTPNPDILCNKFIKFGLFLEAADKLGCKYIATGHYARVKKTGNQCHLLKGVDPDKDQSYFLYTLDQSVLKRVIFPVGGLRKPQVRALARQFKLPVSDKAESMGICFIGKVNIEDFLKQKIKSRPGDILDIDGKKIGRHRGIYYYTLGQRHGFGIKGGGIYYIAAKDPKRNTLTVVDRQNHPALFKKEILLTDLSWTSEPAATTFACRAKIRYRQPDQACRVIIKSNTRARVIFSKPQWAVAPGQSVVFYKGSRCLGGGIVK